MNPPLLLKNAFLVTENDVTKTNVLISAGKIAEIGENVQSEVATEIDANDQYLIPGGIDLDFATTELMKDAAESLQDGVTTIAIEVKHDWLSAKKNLQQLQLPVSYIVVPEIDFETARADVAELSSRDMNLFKLKLWRGRPSTMALDYTSIIRLLKEVRSCGATAMLSASASPSLTEIFENDVHARNRDLGPEGVMLAASPILEAQTISLAASLASFPTASVEGKEPASRFCPILVNRVHSRAALDRLAELQKEHYPLFGGTTGAAIAWPRENPKGVFAPDWLESVRFLAEPPIYTEDNLSQDLVRAATQATSLSFLASGHDGLTGQAKLLKGTHDFRKLPRGLDTAGAWRSSLWASTEPNELPVTDFVRLTATTPARLANLYPRKGVIEVGADADLVLWSKNE